MTFKTLLIATLPIFGVSTFSIAASPHIGTYIPVKGGSFKMGSPTTEQGRYGDEALHDVSLSRAFEVGATEVTQGEWLKLMGAVPSQTTGQHAGGGTDQPVEVSSWWSVLFFANNLSKFRGVEPCYDFSKLNCTGKAEDSTLDCAGTLHFKSKTKKFLDCHGYRLPTEAEWEYVARAGTQTAYFWGDDSTLISDYASYQNNNYKILAVGSKKPNPWGLYDIYGNLGEICHDFYGDYPTSGVIDPVGPSSGSYRVWRGGKYDWREVRDLRSSVREEHKSERLGFRLVRTLNAPALPTPPPTPAPSAAPIPEYDDEF